MILKNVVWQSMFMRLDLLNFKLWLLLHGILTLVQISSHFYERHKRYWGVRSCLAILVCVSSDANRQVIQVPSARTLLIGLYNVSEGVLSIQNPVPMR